MNQLFIDFRLEEERWNDMEYYFEVMYRKLEELIFKHNIA